eukprot:3326140-Prymnesium_polylepis.1
MVAAEDSSVEQRMARIRGRMQWILQQIEGEALTDGGPDAAKHEAELQHQQQVHEAELEEELERQAARLQAQHEAELAGHLAQLRAAHATEVGGLRAQLVAAREEASQERAAAEGATHAAAMESERQR